MALADIRSFLAIDEHLGTAGQPTEEQLGDLAVAGYGAIVNLGLLDPSYCLRDEAGAVASLRLEYRHIPVQFDAPTVQDYLTFASTMDGWADKKVFVHCAANYRASTFVALYGELRLGWPRERADALATKLWPLNETWRAFIARCRAESVA
jgi:protein tyrosine phosphatase (PTP) superfamily phosphohydrolase (DUF442 family)